MPVVYMAAPIAAMAASAPHATGMYPAVRASNRAGWATVDWAYDTALRAQLPAERSEEPYVVSLWL